MRLPIHILIPSACAALFFAVTVLPAFAQGNKANAPGQAKKEEKAIIGNVDTFRGNSLVVEEKKNKKTTETTVDQNTKVVGQDRKLLRLNQIKPKDLVAIVSTDSASATGSGKGKKALKVFVKDASTSATSKRRAIQGVISGISGNVLTLTHQTQTDRVSTLLTTAETTVKMKGATSSGIASLALGMRIAAVGDLNADGTLVARRIHVIPGKARGLSGRVPLSTPSATPATGSGTPTPTATASATPTTTPSVTATPSATPLPTATPTP